MYHMQSANGTRPPALKLNNDINKSYPKTVKKNPWTPPLMACAIVYLLSIIHDHIQYSKQYLNSTKSKINALTGYVE